MIQAKYLVWGLANGALVAAALWIGARLSGASGDRPFLEIADMVDLGTKAFDGQKVVFESDISVRNISQSPVTVDGITTGCGCTAATLEGGMTILPGESRNLRIVVELVESGRFTTGVYLSTSHGRDSLQLFAAAVRPQETYVSHAAVNLENGNQSTIIVVAMRTTSGSPAPLVLESPERVTASAGEWQFVHPATDGSPARWQTVVSVTAAEDADLTRYDSLVVRADGEIVGHVNLCGWPW